MPTSLNTQKRSSYPEPDRVDRRPCGRTDSSDDSSYPPCPILYTTNVLGQESTAEAVRALGGLANYGA